MLALGVPCSAGGPEAGFQHAQIQLAFGLHAAGRLIKGAAGKTCHLLSS